MASPTFSGRKTSLGLFVLRFCVAANALRHLMVVGAREGGRGGGGTAVGRGGEPRAVEVCPPAGASARRLVLPKEVAGSEMKGGDESAQR